MSLTWLYRLSQRNRLLLPCVLAVVSLSIYGVVYVFSEGGYIREVIGFRKTAGVFLLFSLLPAYLFFMMGLLWHSTEAVLVDLKPMAQPDVFAAVQNRLHHLPLVGVLAMLAGVAFGTWQNFYFINALISGSELAGIDVAMFFGNCLLWIVVGLMLCWRIGVSRSISKMGESLDLDIYRLDKLQPLGRLATTEFLVVGGAMAFMPLQSLDASIDAENYLPGMAVGIPAAILLFLLPLWGAHRNIMKRKSERLATLFAQQDHISKDNIAELEPVVAHIDRVKSIPNWPIDVKLITRIFVYVVIAPLAWVCAALVEQMLESL